MEWLKIIFLLYKICVLLTLLLFLANFFVNKMVNVNLTQKQMEELIKFVLFIVMCPFVAIINVGKYVIESLLELFKE